MQWGKSLAKSITFGAGWRIGRGFGPGFGLALGLGFGLLTWPRPASAAVAGAAHAEEVSRSGVVSGVLADAKPGQRGQRFRRGQRVTGGERAKECAWPGVMLLGVTAPSGQDSSCTATLVHPRLILFAAHCGNPHTIIFGEHVRAKHRLGKSAIAKVGRYPEWKNDSMTAVDWAYIKLKEPIHTMPTIPVVGGCEVEVLQKKGAPILFAGFSVNNHKSQDAMRLRFAETTVTSIKDGKINAGSMGITACSGDSGGPMLAKLSDGSWRSIGIASTISNLSGCGKAGVWNSYAQVRPAMLEWIEKSSGIDILPCFDLAGKPTPSPECDAFRAYSGEPKKPLGKRATQCKAASRVYAGQFCEVPKSEEPGEDEDGKDSDDSSGSSGSASSDDNSATTSTTGSDSAGASSESPDTSNKDGSASSSSTASEGVSSSSSESEEPEDDEDDDEDDDGEEETTAPKQAGSQKTASGSRCRFGSERGDGTTLILLLAVGLRRRLKFRD